MIPDISIAPMVDVSTVYFRQLMRILSSNTKIYTEMLSSSQVIKDPLNSSMLYIHPNEYPVVGQLGGSDPEILAESALVLQNKGFSEINLNCGCPSSRVKNGCFGACLMLDPDLVQRLCSEMIKKVTVPVTVKCRIGVDNNDSYPELFNFIDTVCKSGVNEFIIHARKAYLSGLSPAENRTVPELKYSWVYELQKDFPGVKFHINGGISTHEAIKENLGRNLGVMIGRLAYEDPWFFKNIDSLYYQAPDKASTRGELLELYSYACEEIVLNSNTKPNKSLMTKPIINLFKNERGSKYYRAELDRLAKDKDSDFTENILEIIEFMKNINPDAICT